MPRGLQARLCHAFIVFVAVSVTSVGRTATLTNGFDLQHGVSY